MNEGGERFKLFQLGHRGYYNGNNYTWTCSPVRSDTDRFVIVRSVGDAYDNLAHYTTYVCPCQCFGTGN